MTGGQDKKWRRMVVEKLTPKPDGVYLDIGTGTGDLAYEILEQQPEAWVIAADFTLEMMLIGKARARQDRILWVVADSENLPFKDCAFNGVVSGYLLRNVPSPERTLQEQARVLVSRGSVVSLDTTPPKKNLIYPLIWVYLHVVIPILGTIIAGNADAYTYLPDTTQKFLTAERLAEQHEKAGLQPVKFIRKMFGTMAIHWATKS